MTLYKSGDLSLGLDLLPKSGMLKLVFHRPNLYSEKANVGLYQLLISGFCGRLVRNLDFFLMAMAGEPQGRAEDVLIAATYNFPEFWYSCRIPYS
ncbi:MAG: hypothetical protein IPO72_11690 [Saprospiraceae bacterium]|nr:hypothetical protein [Candidatus Vicinibacter affinis]